jgi:membrane-bound metal-dependent hydrolase YbcI (DUF457 family)
VGLFTIGIFHPASTALFLLFLMIGSAFADIDHPDSKFGKNVPIIGMLFTHRGFFHSLLAIVLFTGLVHLLFGTTILTIAFALGYLSHIAIDALTFQGIMPFHPLSDYRIKGFMKSNGLLEYALMGVLVLAIVIKIF